MLNISQCRIELVGRGNERGSAHNVTKNDHEYHKFMPTLKYEIL